MRLDRLEKDLPTDPKDIASSAHVDVEFSMD